MYLKKIKRERQTSNASGGMQVRKLGKARQGLLPSSLHRKPQPCPLLPVSPGRPSERMGLPKSTTTTCLRCPQLLRFVLA